MTRQEYIRRATEYTEAFFAKPGEAQSRDDYNSCLEICGGKVNQARRLPEYQFYSDHGKDHILAVVGLACTLLEKWGFFNFKTREGVLDPGIIKSLLLAAVVHDVKMVTEGRKNHYNLTRNELLSFGVPQECLDTVGQIAYLHSSKTTSLTPNSESPYLPLTEMLARDCILALLGIVLRIADCLDCFNARIGPPNTWARSLLQAAKKTEHGIVPQQLIEDAWQLQIIAVHVEPSEIRIEYMPLFQFPNGDYIKSMTETKEFQPIKSAIAGNHLVTSLLHAISSVQFTVFRNTSFPETKSFVPLCDFMADLTEGYVAPDDILAKRRLEDIIASAVLAESARAAEPGAVAIFGPTGSDPVEHQGPEEDAQLYPSRTPEAPAQATRLASDEPLARQANNLEVKPMTREQEPDPTLYDLWDHALRRPGDYTPRSDELLEGLPPKVKSLKLTALQREVWKNATVPNDDPFCSQKNVILAGPTSSGKTTLGEMFLLQPCLLGSERTVSLYIAPTRALAQARFASLSAILANAPQILEGLVLSTGEDSDDDARVIRGDFQIGCMVYEKANILFSRPSAGNKPRLLERIGCVVVDELHMLADLSRGPTLELALAKLLLEQFRDSSGRDALRVVAITTETPEPAVLEWLHSPQDASCRDQQPIIVVSRERPVPVKHYVVQGVDVEGASRWSFRLIDVATFGNDQARTITAEGMQALTTQWGDALDLRNSYDSYDSVIIDRVQAFTLQLLSETPCGRRILVFVPSKNNAEDLAKRLAKAIATTPCNSAIEESLITLLAEAEHSDLNSALAECAKQGVFFHHADVDKPIRAEIERITGERLAKSAASQVLVATETLSYGVNLAVHDVVLASTMFFTQTRGGDVKLELLSPCDFHNMVGRAGRLGKIDDDDEQARVFVIPGPEWSARRVIDSYYFLPQPDRQSDPMIRAFPSQLFHMHDFKATPAGKHNGTGGVDVKRLSSPFVKAMLDTVRHESLVKDLPILDFSLLKRSLSCDERPEDKTFSNTFEGAKMAVISYCLEDPPGLIYRNGPEYAVTPLGAAVIDTGTELKTVTELLEWATGFENVPGFVALSCEIWLLAIVCTEEVFRQYRNRYPEDAPIFNQLTVDAQRKTEDLVNALFREAVAATGTSREEDHTAVADKLFAIVKTKCGSQAWGALRMFAAVMAWLRLEAQSAVAKMVLKYVDNQGRLGFNNQGRLPNFPGLMETISWKVICLAKVLEKRRSKFSEFNPKLQRGLLVLVERVRYGCPAEAVPMFRHGRVVTRTQVKGLLDAKVDASLLLAGPRLGDPLLTGAHLTAERVGPLCERILRHASARFRNLRLALTDRLPQNGGTEKALRRVTNMAEGLFRSSSSAFKKTAQAARAEAEASSTRQSLLEQFVAGLNELVTAMASDSKQWNVQGQKDFIELQVMADDDGQGAELTIFPVVASSDWCFLDAAGNTCSATALGQRLSKAKHSVLVPFPWLPLAPGGEELWALPGLVIASPMALLTGLTLACRNLMGAASFTAVFAAISPCATAVTLQQLVDEGFDKETLNKIGPPLLQEMLEHFEVALYRVKGEEGVAAPVSLEDEIAGYLSRVEGWCSRKQVLKELGIKPTDFDHALQRMREQDRVISKGAGDNERYMIG